MKISEIISKDNAKIKKLKKLRLKKYRDKFFEFTAENAKIIFDGANMGHYPKEIYLTNKMYNRFGRELDFLSGKNKINEIYIISEKINNQIASLDTAPGIIAVYDYIKEKLDEINPVIYLNEVSDPANVGGIMRNMAAFGFYNLILDEKCADIYNPKTIHAAKNTIFNVNYCKDKDCKILKQIKKSKKIIGTDVKKSKDLAKIDKISDFCLVFGSEANGIDEKVKKYIDYSIHIPISNDVESLNVGAATAIMLYHFNKIINK